MKARVFDQTPDVRLCVGAFWILDATLSTVDIDFIKLQHQVHRYISIIISKFARIVQPLFTPAQDLRLPVLSLDSSLKFTFTGVVLLGW